MIPETDRLENFSCERYGLKAQEIECLPPWGPALIRRAGELGWDQLGVQSAFYCSLMPTAQEEQELTDSAQESCLIARQALQLLYFWKQIARNADNKEQQKKAARGLAFSIAKDLRALALALEAYAAQLAEERCVEEALLAMDFMAPFAARFGLEKTRRWLEDTSLAIAYPEVWSKLSQELNVRQEAYALHGADMKNNLKSVLEAAGLTGEVTWRVKHLAGAWIKMRKKNVPQERVFDLLALRAVLKSPEDCYKALDIARTLWPEMAEEFDDWIKNPKPNGYQSLHAIFQTEFGPFELQLRDEKMHAHAENGPAAHWAYKDGTSCGFSTKDLGLILDWGSGNDLSSLKEAFNEFIWILTPTGHGISMETNSTALDCAFTMDWEMGLHCQSIHINGQSVPFMTQIKNGDVIDVITDPTAEPKPYWLDEQSGYLNNELIRMKLKTHLNGAAAPSGHKKQDGPCQTVNPANLFSPLKPVRRLI